MTTPAPTEPSAPFPKTYVLAGYDDDKRAFTNANDLYKTDPNSVLLTVKKYPDINDAIKQIKPPANIVLDCHNWVDADGKALSSFRWSEKGKGPEIPYSQLFAALKALPDGGNGIKSIILPECYGGIAENPDFLAHAPAGMIVQSQVSSRTPNFSGIMAALAQNIRECERPTIMFIGALATLDPEHYQEDAYSDVAQNPKDAAEDMIPMDALPHIIGIGGNPPVTIDLATEVKKLVDGKKPINTTAWQSALVSTAEGFEVPPGEGESTLSRQEIENIMKGGYTPQDSELPMAITIVADKMRNGMAPEGVQETRIAYALAAAYIDTSGELARLVKQQKDAATHQNQPVQKAAMPALDKDTLAVVGQHGATLSTHVQATHAATPATSYTPATGLSAAPLPSSQKQV